jgi:hypothetical protein
MINLLEKWRADIKRFLIQQSTPLAQQLHARSVVDIGIGDSTKILKSMFPNLEVIDYARDTTHKLDICEDIPDAFVEQYDLVCCCEVLEHSKNPFVAANNTMVLAKPGGLVLVTMPCMIQYHAMAPFCGDYWRFFESSIPLLFTYKSKILSTTSYYMDDNPMMPIGITAAIRRLA